MQSLTARTILATVLTGIAAPASLAAQSGAQTFHIELSTLPGCYQHGCESLFSDFATKDIFVLENGRQYRAQLTPGDRPAFPPHLLVVFAPGARRPGNAKLAGMLKDPLSKGWRVSVAREDGTFTPYSGKDTLAQALAGASAVPSGATELHDLNSAIATLDGIPGRRALLVVNTRKAALPQWVNDTAGALAPVYVVDGGEQKRAYFWTDAWSGGVSEPMENWKTVTKRAWNDGIMHEIKLPLAVKHIMTDSRYDYDLSFSVPASEIEAAAKPLAVRVELNQRRAVTASGFAISIPDSMRIGLYTVANQTADAAAEARIAIPEDATVVWRCDFGAFPTVLLRIAGREVLPRPTPPNGTVLVSYTAGSGPANKSTQAVAGDPQTLQLEASNLLGTALPHSK